MGVLNRLRPWFSRAASSTILPLLLRVSGNPNHYTAAGLALAAAAAIAAYQGLLLVSSLMALASGFMDAVDGLVARATGRSSRAGEVLDASADRVSDFLLHLALLYAGAPAALAMASLAGSMMVSYLRARGEAAGVKMRGVGVAERGERLLVIAAGLALAEVFGPAAATASAAAVAAASWLTAAERMLRLLNSLRATSF